VPLFYLLGQLTHSGNNNYAVTDAIILTTKRENYTHTEEIKIYKRVWNGKLKFWKCAIPGGRKQKANDIRM
jgi:hypothetical protein